MGPLVGIPRRSGCGLTEHLRKRPLPERIYTYDFGRFERVGDQLQPIRETTRGHHQYASGVGCSLRFRAGISSNVPEAASLRSRLGEGAKVPEPQLGVCKRWCSFVESASDDCLVESLPGTGHGQSCSIGRIRTHHLRSLPHNEGTLHPSTLDLRLPSLPESRLHEDMHDVPSTTR